MAKRDVYAEIADELRQEILAVAKSVAGELGPPMDAYDGRPVPRAQYIEDARAQSFADPGYLQKDLDRMAPALIPMPGGQMLRSPTGVRNFLEKWHEARPDLYAHAILAQPQPAPPAGAQPTPPPAPVPPATPPPAPPGGAPYG